MKKLMSICCLLGCWLLTFYTTAQTFNTFGTTSKFTICTEYNSPAGELATGVYIGGATDSTANNVSILANGYGTIGAKLMLGYCSGKASWYSGLEIVNPASGYGKLAHMRSGGKVGIGIANPEWPLQIWTKRNAGNAVIAMTGGDINTLWFSEGDALSNSPDNVAQIKYDGLLLKMGAGNADLLNLTGSKIGIITTEPSERIEILGGNIYSNEDNSGLLIDSSGNKRVGFMKYAGTTGSLVHGNTVPLRFGRVNQADVTGGTYTEEMCIDTAGNVGIGNPNPTKKLTVNGDGYFTGNVITGSSRTLKKGIQDLSEDEALLALKEIKPVKFQYKADTTNTQRLGFIAEDVPELVAEKDRKSLSDMNFTTLAITVIQKQQKQIEELEKKVAALLAEKREKE